MTGRDGDDGERPKRSWREIDQMRDGTRGRRDDPHSRPRGRVAQARIKHATEAYLRDADKIFDKRQGGEEADRLTHALRDAHGTPGLADACRAYRVELGTPTQSSLLALFLDSDDQDLIVAGITALKALHGSGGLEVGSGLRSQLRVLAQGVDDVVAEAAEELLELL